jgi:hypothetical protein
MSHLIRSIDSILAILLIICVGVQAQDMSMSYLQEGASREPLDVSKVINYNIKLTDVSNSMKYSVTLTAGPDQRDLSIARSIKKSIQASPGGANTESFQINFMDPEFRRGEFGEWLNDADRTEVWDNAWWKVEAIDLNPFSDDLVTSDFSGHPTLIKFVWKLEDAKVTPKEGTSSANFTYEVRLFSTASDNVTLEVAPTSGGPWTHMGSQDYVNAGSWQTLRWCDISLPFEDFGAAAYRFTGRRQQTFDGPFWPVALQFNNTSLSPLSGNPRREFTYTLEVNASRSIDVVLNVMDVGTKEHFPAGVVNYNDISTWQTLTWPDIRVTTQEDVVGMSSYYFTFNYPGSEAGFNSTQEVLGMVYPGPRVSEVEIKASVTPSNGTIYTPFTYTAMIDTAKAECDIELEILPPNEKIWDSKGKQTYCSIDQILIWPELSFRSSPEVLGMGKFRFVMDNVVLGEFAGPNIDVAVRNESFRRLPSNNFDYSAEVRSIRPQVEMELMFTDDGLVWKRSGLYRTYISGNSSSDIPPWITLTWENQPWHKSIRIDEKRS